MAGEEGVITLEVLAPDAVPSEVLQLYERAFPARERLPVSEMLSWGTGYRLLNGGDFCGLAFVSTRKDISWLLFFAIAEGCRGRGVGTRALAALEQRHAGQRLIIDVEAELPQSPNLAERHRRIAFWRRNGFQDAGFGFNWHGEQYAFLVKGGTLTYDEVRQFWRR